MLLSPSEQLQAGLGADRRFDGERVLVVAPGWPAAQRQRWQAALGSAVTVVGSLPALVAPGPEADTVTGLRAVVLGLRGDPQEQAVLAALAELSAAPTFDAVTVGVVVGQALSDVDRPFPLLAQVRELAHLVVATADADTIVDVAGAVAWQGGVFSA